MTNSTSTAVAAAGQQTLLSHDLDRAGAGQPRCPGRIQPHMKRTMLSTIWNNINHDPYIEPHIWNTIYQANDFFLTFSDWLARPLLRNFGFEANLTLVTRWQTVFRSNDQLPISGKFANKIPFCPTIDNFKELVYESHQGGNISSPPFWHWGEAGLLLVLTSCTYYETSWWRQIALRSWIEVLIVCNGNSASHTFDGQVDHSWCEISQAPKFAGILKNMDLYMFIWSTLI